MKKVLFLLVCLLALCFGIYSFYSGENKSLSSGTETVVDSSFRTSLQSQPIRVEPRKPTPTKKTAIDNVKRINKANDSSSICFVGEPTELKKTASASLYFCGIPHASVPGYYNSFQIVMLKEGVKSFIYQSEQADRNRITIDKDKVQLSKLAYIQGDTHEVFSYELSCDFSECKVVNTKCIKPDVVVDKNSLQYLEAFISGDLKGQNVSDVAILEASELAYSGDKEAIRLLSSTDYKVSKGLQFELDSILYNLKLMEQASCFQ